MRGTGYILIPCQVGCTTLIMEWEEDEQKGLQVKTPS